MKQEQIEQVGWVEQVRAALEAACPDEPMVQDEQGGCVWCGACGPRGSLAYPRVKDHAEDCGWLLGRKALALLPTAEQEAADTERLNWLEECRQNLNRHYGTNYGWRMVRSHNVNRLIVDLNDSHPNAPDIRKCIDAARGAK